MGATAVDRRHATYFGGGGAQASGGYTARMSEERAPRLPTWCVSHGGGPWPWLDEIAPTMAGLAQSLRTLPATLAAAPRGVLMISAHWESPSFALMSHARPLMLYDYYGFPPHTYRVSYPAPGSPELAARVRELIAAAGVPSVLDAERGFDHGAFVPMAEMWPDATMPLVQLSLRTGLDPAAHLALGRPLAPLRDDGVLIVGSGLSWHNLGRLGPEARVPSQRFDAWWQDTLVASTPTERTSRLLHWSEAPSARDAHPREEHLLPLMVAVGAAEHEAGDCPYREDDVFGGTVVSSFRFGA
jgi:aromatic ring-opening dioxygenase catalytic subunit (LigB family)